MKISTTANVMVFAGLVALASACSTPSQPPAASAAISVQPGATAGVASAPSPAASATAASAVAAKAAPPKSDLESLQGSWKGQEVGGDEGTATLAISGRDIEY